MFDLDLWRLDIETELATAMQDLARAEVAVVTTEAEAQPHRAAYSALVAALAPIKDDGLAWPIDHRRREMEDLLKKSVSAVGYARNSAANLGTTIKALRLALAQLDAVREAGAGQAEQAA